MMIDLQKEPIAVCETVSQKRTEVSAENDVIVPDTQPDILKILQIDGRAHVESCDVQADKIVLRGTAEFSILYIPDTGGTYVPPVKCIKASAPFGEVFSVEANEAGTLHVRSAVDVTKIESMLINSRKLSIKATVAIDMQTCRHRETEAVSAIESDEAMEIKTKTVQSNATVADGTFTVTVADKLEVPSEKPPVGEILKMDAAVLGQDVKLITNKAIIKGVVKLCTLYLRAPEGDTVEFMEHDIPFTEILDLSGAAEGMDCDVNYNIQNIYYEADGAEATAVGAEITLVVTADVRCMAETTIVEDCYAPQCETVLTRNTCPIERISEVAEEQISVRKTVSLPSECPPILQVYNVVAKPFIKEVRTNDRQVEVEGVLDAYILYLTEEADMPLFSYGTTLPFQYTATADATGTTPMCHVSLLHCGYTISGDSAVDIRANIALSLRLTAQTAQEVITDVTASESAAPERASVVISFVSEGDTLWNIAKKYRTTAAKIATANGLDEALPVAAGSRLLIP